MQMTIFIILFLDLNVYFIEFCIKTMPLFFSPTYKAFGLHYALSIVVTANATGLKNIVLFSENICCLL